ncbi:MAG TPA: DUF4442 domain-containing protein [Ferruginibacter sp.]|nr:DUF4442 domain-containing protein [Ferruginibacter sp.]
MTNANNFFDLVRHPIKFRLFLLTKLPSAYFCGVRVRYADTEKCVVTVPYKWFSTNPFRSTYFACLSMAAEMSTGVLAMAHTYRQDPAVSMLVLKVEGNFMKKATGITTFTCEDGKLVTQLVREALSSGKATTATMRSTGKNKDGDTVAEFAITWTFKSKAT